MEILRSFFLLLLFQFAGEATRKVAHIPIPGPVIGMALLAGWYILRRRDPEPAMQQTANALLAWLGLLFVPAGVGIIANLALLRAAWLPITVSLLGSTVATLLTTAWLMQRLGRRSA